MTGLFITALIMGAIGTFHCIGMCGPIAISLPVIDNRPGVRFISTLLYNFGRIITYSILGMLFGIAGAGFILFGYQQALSILMGILVLVFLFLPKHYTSGKNPLSNFMEITRKKLSFLFSKKSYQSVFFIGILNGLLPCGLIYVALATAVSTGSIINSSLFMMGFGLGTLPVMWSVAFFGGFANMQLRNKIKQIYPFVMFTVGLLLIIRGLGLNIPYLSPGIHHTGQPLNAIGCHD